jgi:hypothetical protein
VNAPDLLSSAVKVSYKNFRGRARVYVGEYATNNLPSSFSILQNLGQPFLILYSSPCCVVVKAL